MDKTELQATKIREAAATKRSLDKEKEETKREKMRTRNTHSYVVRHLITCITLFLLSIMTYEGWKLHFENKHPNTCVDTIFNIDRLTFIAHKDEKITENHEGMKAVCPYPNQSGILRDNHGINYYECKCPDR